MKTKKHILKTLITLAIICGATTSCSSFLDEVNHHSQSADEYFATANGYETLINGAYSTLKSVYNSKDRLVLGQIGTDIATQYYSGNVNPVNQYTVTYDSNQENVSALWNNLYAALKNVNAAIERADNVLLKANDPDGIEENILKQRVAEAKALRALYLFEIVRNWEQAPLMLSEPKEAVKTAEYTGGEAFYEQILTDLADAIAVLPARQTGNDYGRMSASSARHLRALVYLTRGYQTYADSKDFENAFKDAEEVYLNSGHKLLDDFQMVHRQSNEINDEIIFCVGFSNESNHNKNTWPKWYLFPYREGWQGLTKDSYYGNDDATLMPTKYAYLMYDWKKDRRASVTFMSPVNGNPETSTDGRNTGKNWFQCTDAVPGLFEVGDMVIYFPVPTDSDFKVWTQQDKDTVKYTVYNFPTGDPADMSTDDYFKNGYQSNNSTTRAFLPVWKFKDANVMWLEDNSPSGTRDIYLFRLAETCLIATEAAIKNNDNTNALKYINLVRDRAKNNAPEQGLPSYTGTITIDNVLDERAMELFGEVSRWNDLQRTGKLAERVLKYNWDVTHITGGTQTLLSASTFENKYKLRPHTISLVKLPLQRTGIRQQSGMVTRIKR